MIIIAISGWKRSGKDTVAGMLTEKFGFKRISFADPLKKMVMDTYGLSLDQVTDQTLKETAMLNMPVQIKDKFTRTINEDLLLGEFRGPNGEKPSKISYIGGDGTVYGMNPKVSSQHYPVYWTPRALCILEGSIKRSVFSDFWVEKAVKQMDVNGLYVISDIRYRSEIAGIKMNLKDGDRLFVVRVNRFETCDSNDASERDLDTNIFDHVIHNTEGKKTLKDLETDVTSMMRNFLSTSLLESSDEQ